MLQHVATTLCSEEMISFVNGGYAATAAEQTTFAADYVQILASVRAPTPPPPLLLAPTTTPSRLAVSCVRASTNAQLLARVNPNALGRPSAEATMLQPLHSAVHANWMIAAIAHDPRAATVSAAHAAWFASAVFCAYAIADLWLEVVCTPAHCARCP